MKFTEVVASCVWQGAVCRLEEVAGATSPLQEVEACCVKEWAAGFLEEVAP